MKSDTQPDQSVRKATFLNLFLSTFRLSLFTLGGGYVIVPLMRNLFVENYRWIDSEEMLDIIAIAQSSPGPIAVNTSILVGYRMKGVRGAAFSLLGTILPAMLILSVLSFAYESIQENRYVQVLFDGMRIGVSAVIIHAVLVMARTIVLKKDMMSIIIMAAAFILAFFFKVHITLVIAAGMVTGLSHWAYGNRRKNQ